MSMATDVLVPEVLDSGAVTVADSGNGCCNTAGVQRVTSCLTP
jgi:hypothetical protein